MERIIFFWTDETERPQPRRIIGGQTTCISCGSSISPDLKLKTHLCGNCKDLSHFSLDYKEAIVANSKLRQSKIENQTTPVEAAMQDSQSVEIETPGQVEEIDQEISEAMEREPGEDQLDQSVKIASTGRAGDKDTPGAGSENLEEEKELHDRYRKNGFLPVLYRGYHPKYNPGKDYKTAKKPITEGFTKPDYIGPIDQEIKEWKEAGGWIGWLIPEGLIILDVDRSKEDEEDVLEICHFRNIHPGVQKSKHGIHVVFITEHKLRATSDLYTKSGIRLTYRVGGKNCILLEPSPDKKWIDWKDHQFLPLMPPEFLEYDRNSIEGVLNCLSH